LDHVQVMGAFFGRRGGCDGGSSGDNEPYSLTVLVTYSGRLIGNYYVVYRTALLLMTLNNFEGRYPIRRNVNCKVLLTEKSKSCVVYNYNGRITVYQHIHVQACVDKIILGRAPTSMSIHSSKR